MFPTVSCRVSSCSHFPLHPTTPCRSSRILVSSTSSLCTSTSRASCSSCFTPTLRERQNPHVSGEKICITPNKEKQMIVLCTWRELCLLKWPSPSLFPASHVHAAAAASLAPPKTKCHVYDYGKKHRKYKQWHFPKHTLTLDTAPQLIYINGKWTYFTYFSTLLTTQNLSSFTHSYTDGWIPCKVRNRLVYSWSAKTGDCD